jgi:hypothetical protein
MKITHAAALAVAAIGTAVSLFGEGLLAQGAASPDQMVASLKTNLQESQKRLRTYEWIETTVISLKGEEKSRKQQQAYYGADGKLTKIPMGGAPQAQQQPARGGRGGGRLKERIVENKKDEMQEYMERAAALIQRYVPPSPELIQKAKDGGHVKLQPPNQGRIRVEFSEFVQPGDLLAIDVDAAASQLAAVNVKTYLDKPEEAVTLDVRYATLTDGTSYISQTTLNAAAKNIIVVVQNSGHKPLAAR